MLKRFVSRVLLGLIVVAVVASLGASLGSASATAALASGKTGWHVTFSARAPSFGFAGSCDLAGATSYDAAGLPASGNSGNCQFAEYFHNDPGFPSGTCEISFTLVPEADSNGQLQPAWQQGFSNFTNMTDWFFSGSQVIKPADRTAICEQFPGVSPMPVFSNFDAVIPAVLGHANLSGLFGTTEFQLQETPLPPGQTAASSSPQPTQAG